MHVHMALWVWGKEVLEVVWITPNPYLKICDFHFKTIICLNLVQLGAVKF